MTRYCLLVALLASFSQRAAAEPQIADSFYQELDVQRRPSFDIQGLQIAQFVHYKIVSWFIVHQPNARGDRLVIQEIRDTRLLEADPLSKMVFQKELAGLVGSTLKYEFDLNWRVLKFQGTDRPVTNQAIEVPDASGVMVANVMDDDGWKELARFTLFQPPPDADAPKPFKYMTRHDWGSLGAWYGETDVTYGWQRGTIQNFGLQHRLDYIPPGPNRKPELPFKVRAAKFRTLRAEAEIHYDQKVQRISEAREWFTASGTVDATMLGSDLPIKVHEQQVMTIRLRAESFRLR